MTIVKEELKLYLFEKLNQKIQYFENLIEQTRASNNDTKSSMGDKYETGREMLQQEINNLQTQLNEVIKQQNALKSISSKPSEKSEKGALVQTDKGVFYISVSVGEINFNGNKIFCISSESPLAQAMNSKPADTHFILNGIQQKILSIL